MSPSSDRKNLLILISDEHRKDAMGCVGHPIVQTPNLDALAARGAVFENAEPARFVGPHVGWNLVFGGLFECT